MPEPYGVVPTGFSRKTLPEILADMETAAVAVFGSEVNLDPRGRIGQLLALIADQTAEGWEVAEDVYQSFDVDGAQGGRLDTLAKLRRLARETGELDADFQQRISNRDVADITLTAQVNRLLAVPGVTWASARENATPATDALGIPAHSVAYAVEGGADADVGAAVFGLSASGSGLHGNTTVDCVVNGYCRQSAFIRPVAAPITIEYDVRHIPGPGGGSPPASETIAANAVAALTGYRNGDPVTLDQAASAGARTPGIRVQETRIARDLITPQDFDDVAIDLFERATFDAARISVRFV